MNLRGANRGLLVRASRLRLGELLAAYGIGAIVDGTGAIARCSGASYGVGAIF